MVPSDSSIFQFLDPLGQLEDSITKGDVEVGHPPVVLDISIRSSLEYALIILDTVVEPVDLLFEVVNFAGLLGIASGNGCKEPFSDGSENVSIEVGGAAKVVATVLGDIGGSGLSTGLTGRGMWFSVGKALERLIELFEDIGTGWQDWLDARKLKYMRARSRTRADVGSVMVMGKKYNSAESVGLGVGGIKMAGAMPTYLSW
jgi:hypothetical protein